MLVAPNLVCNLFCISLKVRNKLCTISVFTMTFPIQVRDWLIRVVWVGINQSRTRIVKDIINSENCYVIYLLRIIDIQKIIPFIII